MDFEGAEPLQAQRRARRSIRSLRLRDAGRCARSTPLVYVNDNYGLWNSERSMIVEHSREAGRRRAS